MVLTFTLAAGLVIAEGRDATREMLVAIIGCNIAWGVIDAGMFIMTRLFERSRNARLRNMVTQSSDDERALSIIRGELDPQLIAITEEASRRLLYQDVLRQLRAREPARTAITRADVWGAIATFWLVFLSTIPAILPFLIFDGLHFALRISNGLLLGMLFFVGYRWARHTNAQPWVAGLSMLVAGSALVGIAVALGG